MFISVQPLVCTMPLLPFNGKKPAVPRSVFIDPTALIIGDVQLGENCSIWPNVVIRGDANTITIGANTNIQENVTLHTPRFAPLAIGENVSIGHHAVIHGSVIGNHCLIGMNATLLNLSEIGDYCMIGAGGVVKESQQIPPNKIAVGVPAKVVRDTSPKDKERIERNAEEYLELKEQYMRMGRGVKRL